MKKSIYAFLAVLTVFAMVMTGCPDGDSGTNPADFEVEIGGSVQIHVPENLADAELVWTSSNTAVATVNAGGFVTGVSLGSVTITAAATDGRKATWAVTVIQAISSDVKVEGNTLVHNPVKLLAANRWTESGTPGTANDEDGSYTFDGTSGQYNGDGAQYNFPIPKANDTWTLTSYDLVEIHFKVTDGSVQALAKKGTDNIDLSPYPTGSQSITFDSSANGGVFTFKAVIGEAVSGIGFQRISGGPATIAIEKVVFSKGTIRTITFTGGAYTAMPAIEPIKIPDGRTVNFGGSYVMPKRPKWAGHTFTVWNDGTTQFDQEAGVTRDLTLTAQWEDGDPPPVDMGLNLNPNSWGDLPANGALTGGSPSYTIPAEYATTAYADGKLTITFDGRNRQRAIIPLSAEQIEELMDTPQAGVTFKIEGTVARGAQGTLTNTQIAAGNLGFAGFRLHLADPTATANWNGTNTGLQTPLTGNSDTANDHLVEYAAFSANKKAATLGFFVIQAMFRDNNNNPDSIKEGFPKVIITIDSVTVDIGNTTQ